MDIENIEKFTDGLVNFFLDKYDLFNEKRYGCDSYIDDGISFTIEGNRVTLVMSFPWGLNYFSDKTLQYENIKFIFQVVVVFDNGSAYVNWQTFSHASESKPVLLKNFPCEKIGEEVVGVVKQYITFSHSKYGGKNACCRKGDKPNNS